MSDTESNEHNEHNDDGARPQDTLAHMKTFPAHKAHSRMSLSVSVQ